MEADRICKMSMFSSSLTRSREYASYKTKHVRREQRHGAECEMKKKKNATRIAIDGNIVDEIGAYI